jgi:tetratricopeptide (TPR) repeat protein
LRTRQAIDARRDREQAIAGTLRWLGSRRDAGRWAGGSAPVFLPEYRPREFVGRAAQLELLRKALVDEPGVFLLTGEPGCGKSMLAIAFGWQAQRDFDAVVFQTCGQRAADLIANDLASQLTEQLGAGASTLPTERRLALVKEWLRKRQSLLILDDVWLDETLGEGDGLRFDRLIPGPPVSVLLTSRRPTLPWVVNERIASVQSFTREEAEALFQKYLDAGVVDQHRKALLEFAERMERLPIAVAVGADILRRQFGPMEDAARKLAVIKLRNQVHDVPALLDHAIAGRSDAEVRLLRAGAVCAAEGYWLPLAAAIAGIVDEAAAEARDGLVNASLLRMLNRERRRFQLHALLRDRLRATVPSVDELECRHAQKVCEVFREWETRWRDCRECLPEVPAAADHWWRNGDRGQAQELSKAASRLADRIGELDTALRILNEQEKRWAGSTDRAATLGMSEITGMQGLIFQAWGQAEDAMRLFEESESLCRQAGDRYGLQISLGNQALIYIGGGPLSQAMSLLKQQEAICLAIGEKNSLQRCYGNQGIVLRALERWDEALDALAKQETLCVELENHDSLQRAYGNRALVRLDQGRLEECIELLKKKEAICLDLGARESLGHCYSAWGRAARDGKDYPAARHKFGSALDIFRQLKIRHECKWIEEELAKLPAN